VGTPLSLSNKDLSLSASKLLNLVLFDVQSDINSENWSHYCSTRPIEPIEGAGLEEPRAGSPPQPTAAAASPQLGTAKRSMFQDGACSGRFRARKRCVSSTSSSQSIAVDSHSNFVTTRSQHLFSPQNSNNASPPLLTKISSCARAFPTALMRYIFSETLLASCLNYCSCTANAQSRSAEPMTSLFKEDGKSLGNWPAPTDEN
jgi:hypothetical protein